MALSAGTGSSSVEDDPAEAFLQTRTNGPCDEAFFQRTAVQLARHLIGQYLYFHASKTAVRILETEAYAVGDAVYDLRFRDRHLSQFKLKGGVLMAWRPSHHKTDIGDLYVTVGREDSEDLVHIRSCEPVLGPEVILNRRKNPMSPRIRRNLLIGPQNCTEGVGAEWLADPKLYRNERGGVQLFCATPDLAIERMRRGPRVLNYTVYYGCDGTDSPYRFALLTPANYPYYPGLQDV